MSNLNFVHDVLLKEFLKSGFTFSFATIFAAIAIPIIIKLSRKYRLVDNPDPRKMHKTPVPTLGGIGIYLGCFIASLPWMIRYGNMQVVVFAISMSALFIMGIIDDLKDLRASLKFLVQTIVALILAYFGLRIESLDGIFYIYDLPVIIQYALSVVLIVGLINAFNLIDGIDGLAGGLGLINSLVFGTMLVLYGKLLYGLIAFGLAGALLGFLFYNFNPAKIFMGDTGSLIIGFMMAVLGIVVIQKADWAVPLGQVERSGLITIAVGILLLPVYDTLRVFAERILKKKSPFKPDKTHVHHLLIETGSDHRKASLLLYMADILIILTAFFLREANPSFSVPVLFVMAAFLSESINLKRLLIALTRRKKATEEKEKITSENRFLEDIINTEEDKK